MRATGMRLFLLNLARLEKGYLVRRFFPRCLILLWFTACFFVAGSSISAQENSGERIFFNAKVFTGDPQNPYAEAVAIRGEKIVAVGNLAEVLKAAICEGGAH